MDSYSKIFDGKNVVMVVTAHPDDLEAYCGGTIARLTADGKKVVSVKLTAGNRGSRDKTISRQELAAIRMVEDARSMKILGVAPDCNVNLQFDDGTIENRMDIIEQIALQMRRFQPDIVITTNPEKLLVRHPSGRNWVNHRDHRNAGACAIDAVYPYSRDRSFFPDQFKDPAIQPAHCSELLIADSWDGVDEASISVKDYMQQKIDALSCHESQFSKAQAQEVATFFMSQKAHGDSYETFRHVSID